MFFQNLTSANVLVKIDQLLDINTDQAIDLKILRNIGQASGIAAANVDNQV